MNIFQLVLFNCLHNFDMNRLIHFVSSNDKSNNRLEPKIILTTFSLILFHFQYSDLIIPKLVFVQKKLPSWVS